MNTVLNNPAELQRARRKLQRMKLDGRKEVSRLMALAEASFRLAVHPDTAPTDAISLLQEAVRLDGANPKYAYHLGRIYFGRQEFEQSARWFRLACCLAPTSHRVWAHVAVLLRELDGVYRGNDDYEPNVLLRRAKAIEEAIRSGQDNPDPDLLDFVPPPSLASQERRARQRQPGATQEPQAAAEQMRPAARIRRYLHARRCRWSGVDHLTLEQVLAGRPTQANVRQMAPILQQLAGRIPRQPGMAGAFVILCIQWLIVGYPVTTIRRLMGALDEQTAARRLLEQVCVLFEADAVDVPDLISNSVANGQIPPVLGALIHQQRRLWMPLDFRNLGLYRSAKGFCAGQHAVNGESLNGEDENRSEQALELVRRLERAIDGLYARPPKPLKDELPRAATNASLDAAACCELLQRFEAAAQQLTQIKDEGFQNLKEGLDTTTQQIADVDAFQQAVADRAAVELFVQTLAGSAETTARRFDQLVESLSALDSTLLGPSFGTRREECTGALQGLNNIGKFGKVLRRIDKRLDAAQSRFVEGTRPAAPEWNLLIEGLQTAVPDEVSAPAVVADQSTGAGVIDQWLQEADQFAASLDDDWKLLKDALARQKSGALTAEDQSHIVDLRRRLEQRFEVSEARINEIAGLRQTGSVAPDLLEHLDLTETTYLKVLQARGRFQKNLRKLPQADSPPPPLTNNRGAGESAGPGASPPVAGGAPVDAHPGDASGGGTVVEACERPRPPAPPRPREELNAAEILDYTLRCTDWAVDQMFEEAERSLEGYPAWILALPPFQLLRRTIHSRRAETLYRMGRRRQARQQWNRMLRIDRLDMDALKNIAVVDSVEADVGRSMAAWREYIELLYLFDVFVGDPRCRASLRSRFHRSFGNGYAPAFLSARFDNEWGDRVVPAALITFLSSPGRVRNYVDHRLLEYLNTRFEFTSPSLVLGIKRIEAERLTDAALQSMTAYAGQVCQLLPGQVGLSFRRAAEQAFAQAAEMCRDSRRLTLQETPRYREEEKRQIELLARMYDLKLKLVVAFNRHVNMVKNVGSFDFLDQLARLNQIPLELSPGLQPIVAAAMSLPEETLLDLDRILTQNVVFSLMKYLFADDDEAEREIRIRQCELLVTQVVSQPSLREYVQAVDSAYHFFPEDVVTLLSAGPPEPLVQRLRQWHDMYPALGGMAVLLASRLLELKHFDEAQQRLERTLPLAFFAPSRRSIQQMLVALLSRRIQPLLDDEDFIGAFDLILQMVNLDDYQPVLVQNLLQIYLSASVKQRTRHRTGDVKQAVDNWLARAAELMSGPEDEHDQIPRPTQADLQTVRDAVDQMKSQLEQVGLR
jgi:tetratricopeptide (TPR) repeat protein